MISLSFEIRRSAQLKMPLNQKNQYENTDRVRIVEFYLHAEGEPRVDGRAKSIQQIVEEVQERYRQVFNTRSVPCRKTVLRHIRHFRHDASLANHKSTGRPRTVRNNANVELIREILEERPGTSHRQLERETQISRKSIRKLIKDTGMSGFRGTVVQELLPQDPGPNLVHNLIWTDESVYQLSKTACTRNNVEYHYQNPHRKIVKKMRSENVMVWMGLHTTGRIGPYFFPGTVTGAAYLHMMRTFAIPELRRR
ncbi:unnamed protein product, partial [Allacma fusca]